MHTATILAYAVGLASSHVIQVHPPTYVFAADGHYNPLQPDGSDFPCKMPPGVNKLKINGSPTPMVIGETQTLELEAFDGAVHGGGVCHFPPHIF